MISARDNTRHSLERSLIGLCLEHPLAFGELSNILSDKNFRKWDEYYDVDHSLMWRIMNEMYPKMVIDLVSVSHYAKQYYQVDSSFIFHLMQCHNNSANYAKIWTHALLLIEFDMQTKFCELLATVSRLIKTDDSPTAKAAIEECFVIVNERMHEDLLFTIPGLVEYLQGFDIPEEGMKMLLEFVDHINVKLKSFKKQKTLDNIITHLLNYGNFQPHAETKTALDELTEMISIIYLTKKATPDFVNKLQNLKQQLLQA